MGKVCLLLILSFVSVFSAAAQTHEEYVDNFETVGDVKVSPATEMKAATETKIKVADTSDKKIKIILPPVQATQLKAASPATPADSLRMSEGKSLGAFSTGDAVIDGYILASCIKYNIDPLLIYAQMSQESSFRLKAVSHKGARGLMQLMPATAVRLGVKNIYSPQQNIEAGVKYMRWLLDEFGGDVRLALAGYNAGEGAVRKYGNQIPPFRETKGYVARITARYHQIKNSALANNGADVNTISQEVAKVLK